MQVIRRVIADVGLDDTAALKKAISKAYPFGERKHWPYKIWLEEVKRGIAEAQRAKALGVNLELWK